MFGAVLEVEMLKKCTPLWREAGFGANMLKPTHVRTISGGCDVKKVHAVFARSTFRSKNAKKNRSRSDHFWPFNRTTLHYNHNYNHNRNYNNNDYSDNYNYHYTTLHLNTMATTTTTVATLQLQLHHTTLLLASSSCGWGDQCNLPKSTTPPTFRWISGFALRSMHHSKSSLPIVSYLWKFCHRLASTPGMGMWPIFQC